MKKIMILFIILCIILISNTQVFGETVNLNYKDENTLLNFNREFSELDFEIPQNPFEAYVETLRREFNLSEKIELEEQLNISLVENGTKLDCKLDNEILARAKTKNEGSKVLDGNYFLYKPQDIRSINTSEIDYRNRPETLTYLAEEERLSLSPEPRYLGFSDSGAKFDNPAFPWGAWNGKAILEKYFIKNPEKFKYIREKYNLSKLNKNKTITSTHIRDGVKNGILEKYYFLKARETVLGLESSSNQHLQNESILFGQNEEEYEDEIRNIFPMNKEGTSNSVCLDKFVKPTKYIEYGGLQLNSETDKEEDYFYIEDMDGDTEWHDFVYILSYPTEFSWGTGFAFFLNGKDTGTELNPEELVIDSADDIGYMTIPIAPINMHAKAIDFRARATGAKGEYKGNRVNIEGFVTSSSGKKESDVMVKWYAQDENGNVIIDNMGGEKKLNNDGTYYSKTSFIMPDSDVTVTFSVNLPENPKFKEEDYDNNDFSFRVKCKKIVAPTYNEYKLDYDVLSKELEFDLSSRVQLSARISRINGSWWNGPANGGLNVVIEDSKNVLLNNNIFNNPPINNNSSELFISESRNPRIKTKITRETIGDRPGYNWAKNFETLVANPTPKFFVGTNGNYISNLNRPYTYSYVSGSGEDAVTVYVKTMAYDVFDYAEKIIKVSANVYNGMKTLPKIPEHNFKYNVENIEESENKIIKKINWMSDIYNVPVQRYLKNIDNNNNLINYTKRNGQYNRTFMQQNTADITYENITTIEDWFKIDRQNAKYGKVGNKYYPKVPFATDIDLQKYKYPFKAGYYCNIGGKYKVTVKSEIFKNTTRDTDEHKKLVNKVIESFRYASELEFTTKIGNGRGKYKIEYPENKSKYIIKGSSTKIENLFESEDSMKKSTYRLDHEGGPSDNHITHNYYRQLMEGWNESDTGNSSTTYKYKEFVRDPNLNIYKITETSIIEFDINKDNQKTYTEPSMKDGKYDMKAWFNPVTFNCFNGVGNKELSVPTIKLPNNKITFTVIGSMYDD